MPDRPRRLKDFEGRWSLTREIEHSDGTRARFTGQAIWSPDPDGLSYVETGSLHMDTGDMGTGTPITATRRYHWGAELSVYFDDGRFFHKVPPSGGKTAHWCAPDQYDVSYDFAPWPEFHVAWHVRGPRKSYQMTSTYRRFVAV